MATPARRPARRASTRPAAGGQARSLRVRDLAQVRALAHPLRIRLLEAFAQSPRTTRQVARALDEKPTRLYHHVAALERVGLLALQSTRQNRGTIEKYFLAVARSFEVEGSLFGGSGPERGESEAAVMAGTVLDTARVQLLRHIRSGAIPTRGLEPIVGRLTLRATRAELAAWRRRILALMKDDTKQGRARGRGTRGKAARGGEATAHWALTVAFHPVPEDDEP